MHRVYGRVQLSVSVVLFQGIGFAGADCPTAPNSGNGSSGIFKRKTRVAGGGGHLRGRADVASGLAAILLKNKGFGIFNQAGFQRVKSQDAEGVD